MTEARDIDDDVVAAEDLASAVTVLVRTDGWESAAALINRHWDRYLATNPGDLLAAFSALPGEAMVKRPSLVSGTNYLQQVIAGIDPGRFHDNTFDATGRPIASGTSYDRLIALTSRSSSHRTAGRLGPARDRAAEGVAIADALDDRERTVLHDTMPHLLVQWGLSFQFADLGGERLLEESYDLAVLTGQPAAARRAAGALAWTHADHGRLNRAEIWVQRALAIELVNPRYDAPLQLARAMTANDRLDRPAAAEILTAFEHLPVGEYWAALLWVRSWTASTAAEAIRINDQLQLELARQPERLATSGANHRYLTAARAYLATLRGIPTAEDAVEDPDEFALVMSAAAAYTGGDTAVLLRRASAATRGNTPRLLASAHLLVAAARLQLKAPEAAIDAFTRAHTVIESERLHAAYLTLRPAHVTALFELSGLDTPAGVRRSAALDADDAALADAHATLTPRERHVLELMAHGKTGAEIGRELYISANTVKTMTRHVYRKLGLHSREEAIKVAFRLGVA